MYGLLECIPFSRKQHATFNELFKITLAGNDNNRTGSDIQINLDLWRVKIDEQIDKN